MWLALFKLIELNAFTQYGLCSVGDAAKDGYKADLRFLSGNVEHNPAIPVEGTARCVRRRAPACSSVFAKPQPRNQIVTVGQAF